MPLDIYSTMAQLKAIEVLPPVCTFLFDTFAKDMGMVENEEAFYDFKKGVQEMAPFVHPNTGGVLMKRSGFETRKVGFCNIAPERVVRAEDTNQRSFGEVVFGGMTPEQRSKKLMIEDLAAMRLAVQNRREWMVREVLLKGKLEILRYTNEGREVQSTKVADYGFTNFYTPANAWDTANADIRSDMHKMTDIACEGGGMVTVRLMASDVADALINNERYQKLMDVRNYDLGKIDEKYIGSGVRFLGYDVDGAKMYSLSGKFINDKGVAESIIPSGTIISGYQGMVKVGHAPVTQVEEVTVNAKHKTYVAKEVPLRHGSINSNSVMNRLTSRPTVVPFNVDGWVVGHVLTP